MKKINLFNRNTNLPSYRRRGLPFPWERGPAEQPEGMGITPSPLSPTKFLKFCGTRFGATPSWKEGERKVPSFRGNAESPRCCRESVCGKTDGIPLFSGMTAVIFALFVATPSFAEPTELDKKTVASKAYVDTKQDIIEAGLVSLGDDWFENLPSVVSFDSTSGLVGNKYGILDLNGSIDYIDDGWKNYVGDSEVEYLIPTVGAVGRELQYIWDSMPSSWSALSWVVNDDNGANRTNAINAYNTDFGNGTNQWEGNSYHLINGLFLAKSLALKQNKIAKSGYYYPTNTTSANPVAYGQNSSTNGWLHAGVKGTGLVTKTATDGVVGERKIFETTDVANYHATGLTQIQKDIQDISIPTVGAMMTAIANGANAALPTGTTGTVVTYNGTNATTGVQEFTETAISGTATYDDNDQLTNGNNIANVSLVETEIATRQKKRTCAGYEPGHENEADYCWLWNFPD